MNADEEYVRARWEWIIIRQRDDRFEWEWFGSLMWKMSSTLADDETAAIHAAYLFTKERERQIAEARKAVELLQGILRDPLAQHYEDDAEIYRGIAVREQSRLADLKRGMKCLDSSAK